MERLMTSLLELTLPMTLVIVLLLAARPLLGRRFAAKWRYWAWLLVAVRLLLPFGITLPQPVVTLPQPKGEISYPVGAADLIPSGEPIRVQPDQTAAPDYGQGQATAAPTEAAAAAQQPTQTQQPQQSQQPQQPQAAAMRTVSVMELAGLCWLAGAVLFLLWQLGSYLLLRIRLRRSRRPVTDEAVLAVLEQETAAAGLAGVLPVYTAAVGSPMIVGAVKPTLLLPQMTFGAEQLSLVFRHELIHYRRRDIWYKLVLMTANAVHWFNPAVWLMVRAADRDLELSCDEAMVSGRDGAFREEYGRCLLTVVRAGMNRRTLFTTNFYSGKKTLKSRLATIFDTTKKRRGTLSLAALLLAAAVAGSLVACTPDGAGNDGGVDLTDYDAISREYLLPIAALGCPWWDSSQPQSMGYMISSDDLLFYAAYRLYGYRNAGEYDISAAYGTEDTEKEEKQRQLQQLLGEDGNYHLPRSAVYDEIEKLLPISEEGLLDSLFSGVAEPATDTLCMTPQTSTGRNVIVYANDAALEGDILTISYDVLEVQPGEEGFLAQHMADYTKTHEAKYEGTVTIELEENDSSRYIRNENGSCQYIRNEWTPITTKFSVPEGEPAPVDLLQKIEQGQAYVYNLIAGETADWELLGSSAMYVSYDGYVAVGGEQWSHRVNGWAQQQVSVYRTAGGYRIAHWKAVPDEISDGENPEIIKWQESIEVTELSTEEAGAFDFGDMVINLNPVLYGGYSLYSPGGNRSIAVPDNFTRHYLVEQSGSGLIALSDRTGLLPADSRYEVLFIGYDDSDKYYVDYYAYDKETCRLTLLAERTYGQSTWSLEPSDTRFALNDEDDTSITIYDAANPQAAPLVYDKSNLPLDGCDAVYIGGIYPDNSTDMVALMYYPYNSDDLSDIWESGKYAPSGYLWNVTVLDRNDLSTPLRTLTTLQHPARNRWTTYPQGEVLVRGGLLYYSNYYDADGRHTLPNGDMLRERWCFNLTTGQSQMIETNAAGEGA